MIVKKTAFDLIFNKFLLEPYAGWTLMFLYMLCNAQFQNCIKNVSALLTEHSCFSSPAMPPKSTKYKLREPFVPFLCSKLATKPLHFIKNEWSGGQTASKRLISAKLHWTTQSRFNGRIFWMTNRHVFLIEGTIFFKTHTFSDMAVSEGHKEK